MRPTSEIFDILRPICVNLTKSYDSVNVSDVEEFKKTLEKQDLDCISFQELQQYLLFPLKLILRGEKSDIQIQALECTKYIFDNTVIKSWDLFSDFFMQFLTLISLPEKTIVVRDVCEELKMAVVQCMNSLITHSSISIKKEMYKENFHLPLSHAIYVLLCLSENETSKFLKLISVEMIGKFSEVNEWDSFQQLAADRFAAFLPGITTCLVRIISTDFHQGQALTVAVLQVLEKVITLVLSDNSLSNCNTNSEKDIKSKVKLNIPIVVRDEKWKKLTVESLETLLRKVATQVCHSHWKVRLALVEFSRRILFACTSSLQNCISPLLEVCLVLSVDDYKDIAKESSSVLNEFSKHHVNVRKRNVLDILEDDLYNLVLRLPRIFNCQDEKQILLSTNLLLGYLHLFGPAIKYFLYAASHQKRFIIALLHLAELDNFQLEDKIIKPYELYEEIQSIHWPKKSFKYFRSDSIYKVLQNICCVLMQNGDSALLTDCLMEKMEIPIYRQQAILIINECLLGLQSNNKEFCLEEKHMEIIQLFTEVYLSKDFLNIKVSNNIDQCYGEKSQSYQQDDLSADKLNANVQQICLLLEGIANMAKVAGSKFQSFLMQVLFPLMEKAGSSSSSVSHAARLTLLTIACSCKYKNLASLITMNSDYLINKLSLELRHYSHSQSAILVFQVALQLCNDNILPLFQDVIDEVLHILDLYNREAPVVFVNLIRVLVRVIKKWHLDLGDKKEKKDTKIEPSFHQQSKRNDTKQIWKIFLEYHSNKQISEQFVEIDEMNSDDTYDDTLENFENNKKKYQIPLHITVVEKILERCVHLQSSKNFWARVFALEAISDAILVAKDYEDELLPLVHNLWGGFVHRFSDDDLVVCTKAFDTLLIMADICKSFIRQRTMQDVWPKLTRFLENQSKISLQKDADSDYKFTVGYKLQLKLLSELGHLAVELDIQEKELELLITALHPYISSRQPNALQEAATRAFKFLMKLDMDAIWLYLNNSCSLQPEMLPMHSSLRPVYFSQPEREYKQNTELLLQHANANQM